MKTFIDLFAGIGGFRLALERQGLKCVFSSEIDEDARATYQHNFGELPAGDITKIDAKDIPAHDILCAGFPCQSFSISGHRDGLNDKRGALIWDVIRIARHHRPQVLLLENVPGLLSIDNGAAYRHIVEELTKSGYIVKWDLLNAADYGSPQARRRLYIVCLRTDTGLEYATPAVDMFAKGAVVKDILEDDKVDSRYYELKRKPEWLTEPRLRPRRPLRIGTLNNNVQAYRIYSIDGPSITLTSGNGGAGRRTGLYAVADGVRRLTPFECKLLMGFTSDFFVIGQSDTSCYRQINNAVIPAMIELIYLSIEEYD